MAFDPERDAFAYVRQQDLIRRYGLREDVLEFTTRYARDDRAIQQSDGSRWRGFFVEHYRPHELTYLPAIS